MFLFATTLLMMAAGAGFSSCAKSDGVLNPENGQQTSVKAKGHVKLSISPTPSVSFSTMQSRKASSSPALTRAALTAEGKVLTDLYIFDYDKETGTVLQVLHQTSDAEDFAEPDLTLDYGEHTLKVIATRSVSPTLLDAGGADWTVSDNVLTAVGGSLPAVLTSAKTSDTFGAVQDITVGVGKQSASVVLDRIVAQLVVAPTDVYPADAGDITTSLNEYKAFSWQTFDVTEAAKNQRVYDADVTEAAKNQRVYDASVNAGKQNKSIAYYVLVPAEGYTSDVSFLVGRKGSDKPYADILVPGVKLERNKITTISGSFYHHQKGVSVTVEDAWNSEGNDYEI